jgi:tungstate transport system substrate-binding protein
VAKWCIDTQDPKRDFTYTTNPNNLQGATMTARILTLPGLLFLLVSLLVGCDRQEEPTKTPEPAHTPSAEPASAKTGESQVLILATTTSTENSGLLEFILPDFEKEYNVEVDVIAVGTGQALKLGEDGNADVLMVHARAREDAFMDAGHGVRREDLIYNDFVIVGPPDDPAELQGMTNAAAAFTKLAHAQAPFVSRGDDSGTHTKEKGIWQAAGIEPSGDWYISAGQGMGAVLTMADEEQTYTLSDRATYLARTLEGTDLEIVVDDDPILFNPYGVITINPEKGPHIKHDLANTFIDWLISLPTQEKIAQFGVAEFGSPLFTPDSGPWRAAHAGEAPVDVALKITGKVAKEMGWPEAEVRAMDAIQVESTNQKGDTSNYTGVPIKKLLEAVTVQADASTLIYVGDDGSTTKIALTDVQTCDICILSFRSKGGFSIVMPGFPADLQIKGVIAFEVQ